MAPEPVPCRLCDLSFTGVRMASSIDPSICEDCVRRLGLVRLPPPRRRAAPCTRCNGMRFVRSLPREFSGEMNTAYPMTVATPAWITDRQIRAGKDVAKGRPWHGAGVLEVYTCLGCGFVEWYCTDADKIPIGPEHMTDVVDYTTDSPYR